MIPYISLHNHTTFSIGDSLLTPKDLFTTTKELGGSAVAVTDHGSCAGLWDSLKASKSTNVRLIPGAELYFIENISNKQDTNFRHIILLAKNLKGYQNLLTMLKVGYDNFAIAFKKAVPRIDWDILQQYSEGIICTTACGNGIPGQFIMNDEPEKAKQSCKRLQDIFGDDLALELQATNLQRRASSYSGPINQQKINMALKKISHELGIRSIVTTNAHYIKKEHHRAHDAFICISSGQPVSSGARLKYDKDDFYVKSGDDILPYFQRHEKMWGEEYIQSLFSNTVYFADKCESSDWVDPAVATGDKSQLPDFPYQDEPDYQDFLKWKEEGTSKVFKTGVKDDALFYRYKSEKGLAARVAEGKVPVEDIDHCYQAMEEEFDVLEYRNFSSYMLISADFLDWCRTNGVKVGRGRGSVAGSYTGYFTNIHQAYPKKYDLLFARFLNKYKESYPDIDHDIAPSGRAQLHEYLRGKYGYDNVANVSNINKITPKVYARDLSRIFEFGGSREEAIAIGNSIADSISTEIHSITQALKDAPLFAEYAKQYPELEEMCDLIQNKPRAWATHAGGIILSKRSLIGLIPVRRDTSGTLVIEFDKERAEENGLVKIDTLGLETLDIITDTEKLIQKSGKEVPKVDCDKFDQESYDLISKGDVFGVFQLAGTAVTVCQKIKPQNIDDISLITAIVRPGTKENIPALLKIRNGDSEVEYLDPSLKEVFHKTYGFLLYEESLMKLSNVVSSWDLHSSDRLRKLTKEKGKNPEKAKQWRQEFIDDAVNKNNFDRTMAERIWDEIISSSAAYLFNKSHAVVYSMTSFHTAYLKAHFPVEFLVANIMSEVKSNAKVSKSNINQLKFELRNKGVTIVQPDINKSEMTYKIIDDKTLLAGLDSLKFMGKDSIPEILSKRPFVSFKDFMYRTQSSKVRAGAIQAMAAAGALDSFDMPRKQMFLYASDYRAKLRAQMKKATTEWLKIWSKEKGFKKSKDLSTDDIVYINDLGEMQESPPTPKDIVDKYLQEFDYPFPKEPNWTIQEAFALEEFYTGEGISGTNYERYQGFFNKEKSVPFTALKKMFPYEDKSDDEKQNRNMNSYELAQYDIHPIEAIIKICFSHKVKKEDSKIFGQTMCRLVLQDANGNEMPAVAFPQAWQAMLDTVERLSGGKHKIEPGIAIRMMGKFQWDSSVAYSFIVSDILAYKPAPALPAKSELKSRKVKMPRLGKITTKEDVEELDKEEFVEQLEEEFIDLGIFSEDDEDEQIDPFK